MDTCFRTTQLTFLRSSFYNRAMKKRGLSVKTKDPGIVEIPRSTPHPSSPDTASSRLDEGLSIKGNLTGNADLIINGDFSGSIELRNGQLTIGEKARVEAEIHCKSIAVLGTVIGNIFASEMVRIAETGSMTGDITTHKISILDGAKFKGGVKIRK